MHCEDIEGYGDVGRLGRQQQPLVLARAASDYRWAYQTCRALKLNQVEPKLNNLAVLPVGRAP